jgi:hypothetical protein
MNARFAEFLGQDDEKKKILQLLHHPHYMGSQKEIVDSLKKDRSLHDWEAG